MVEMNMGWLDWLITSGAVAIIIAIALTTRKYTKSVADFLAANRCAGRYLLCISEGIAGLGAITVVANFEIHYSAGFTAWWWAQLMLPVGLLIALSGWVVYRFRETRALTLAQFFEERYSKGLRIFAGILMFVSGIVNFGIFPAVGARFFIYYCGLPDHIFGMQTFIVLMVLLLVASLALVFFGGQIAVMITDFSQGIFVNVAFVVMIAALAYIIDWDTMIKTLIEKAPEGKSLVNPFKTGKIEDFNLYYYLIGAFGTVYAFRSWQGAQAYGCSAKSAHEAKMAGILGTWRGIAQVTFLLLVPVIAYALLHSPQFEGIARQAQVAIDVAGKENPQIGRQMTVPIVMAKALPPGILGLFCAVMICAFLSTHDTYLHSWGSIFVQDVILPFRKKPFTPRQHLFILRCSILFVAVFIFIWSLVFRQTQHITMFFVVTGAIWIGGAGSVILGGLYWKRGTTLGAYAALGVGATVALTGIALEQNWEGRLYPWLASSHPQALASLTSFFDGLSSVIPGINWRINPTKFVFHGQWVNFFAMTSAAVSYIVASLLQGWITRAKPYDLERMLHRGKYAVDSDHDGEVIKPASGWKTLIPTEEFTLGDKIIYWAKMAYTCLFIGIFLVGTAWGVYHHNRYGTWFSDKAWATYWWIIVIFNMTLAVFTTIWFLIGGCIDARRLFKTLATAKRNPLDSGMVIRHHDLADESIEGLKEQLEDEGEVQA